MAQRHLYLRDYSTTNKHPIGCVAVATDKASNKIRYAYSVCSPLDRFNSRIARDKAIGRLIQSPVVLDTAVPEATFEITRLVMQHIVATNKDQARDKSRSYLALQAAEGWLSLDEQRNKAQA